MEKENRLKDLRHGHRVFHLLLNFLSKDKTPGGSVPGSAGSLRGVLLGPEGSPSGLGALRRFLSDGFGWRTALPQLPEELGTQWVATRSSLDAREEPLIKPGFA
ncbi:hypothetical protein CapIbe_017529 [Capra ibex]